MMAFSQPSPMPPLQSSFSSLHRKALAEKRLTLDLPPRLRNRIRKLLSNYNDSLHIQRDPNNSWTTNSSIDIEVALRLERQYGIDGLVEFSGFNCAEFDLKTFLLDCDSARVFDTIQFWCDELPTDREHSLQQELNGIFAEEGCAWVFCDRSFFQIDSKFLEEKVHTQVHELLNGNGFMGALEEFVEARNDFASGDFKGTILNAGKAFESVMKTILCREEGVAGDLIKALGRSQILEDVPENLKKSFESKVFEAVPLLRNKMGGHGQGQQVVVVSRELAELCLNLAGSVILYCIRRKLLLEPPAPEEKHPPLALDEEDIPF